ncbi:MAG: hypothetical protein A2X88_04800 [Deltaproteobacteria bacterium GWC2_65_14]|nr:MAG: hypothetical protein A2X88_04800 [Deltaproteobacteria bacterium GWC2_65_14]
MDHPFRGLGAPLFLALPFLGGFLLGLAAWDCRPAASAFLLLLSLVSALFRRSPLATASCLLGLCGTLAAGRLPFVDPREIAPFLGGEVLLRGRVESVTGTDSGWRGVARDVVLSFPDRPGTIRVDGMLLVVRSPESPVLFPAEVRASGRIHPIRSRGNPLEIPREWNALALRVQYLFSTESGRTVFLPGKGEGLSAIFRAARERTGGWLAAHAGNSSHGAVYLRALATGETPPPGHPLVLLFRKTGLSHLLAISGLHAGIFFAGTALLVRGGLWLLRRRHGAPDLNRISLYAALPACWFYILSAGAPISGIRAAGMITVGVTLWRLLGIRATGAAWTALFLGTTFVAPWSLFSPSFLLSYGAAFFLVACLGGDAPGPDPIPFRRRAIRSLGRALSVSTVAFAGTLPISGALFGGFPAGAVLWNLLFAGLLGTAGVAGAFLATTAGLLSLDGVGPLAGILADGLTFLLELLLRVSGNGRGYLPIPPSGIAAPMVCVGAGMWGAIALRRLGMLSWPAPVAAGVLFLAWVHLPYAALPDPRLTVTALNVGKGASHLVSFPGGGQMLVDCGSRLRGEAGERILLPFLRSRGVRRIDILVLTHPHEDHYGGSEAVLRELEVGEIWIPRGISPAAFGEAVAARRGMVRSRRSGERHRSGGAEVLVRASGAGGNGGKANEQSLVLEVRYRGLSVWLPGDVEQGPSVWGPAPPANGETRVLFLPHHGSPGAKPDAWIASASPVAVIRQNSDCAPPDNLVPSFCSFALENGAVTVRSNGSTVVVEQERGAGFWRLLLRLSPIPEGESFPGSPTRYPEWRNSES